MNIKVSFMKEVVFEAEQGCESFNNYKIYKVSDKLMSTKIYEHRGIFYNILNPRYFKNVIEAFKDLNPKNWR